MVLTPSTFKVSLPRIFMHLDTKVGELINKEDACRKSGAINTLFLPHEAEVIRSIPISTHLPEDKKIWALKPKGLFMVKSAYHEALDNSL